MIVTFSGSPPNRSILSCTHSSATIWSLSPRFSNPSCSVSLLFRNPIAPIRYCIETPMNGSADQATIERVFCILAAPLLNAPPGIRTATGSFPEFAVHPFGRNTLIVRQSSL